MAKLTITIETENDAFSPNVGREVSRIIRENESGLILGLHNAIDGGEFPLRDLNGNTVGRIVWSR